ncbi:MAG: tetratricopeptide repeat protein [Nitrospirae bacterium]|nr:tetratricopeptide repeat protein [Nitrospirota bacterium]
MIKVLLLLMILLLTSCARDHVDIVREKEVKSTTEKILTFQDRPQEKALEYRWKALKTYEEFIKANKGYKSGMIAKGMQELADIYMEIEENTYIRKKVRFDHSRSRRLYKEVLGLYPDRLENEGILYQLARGYMEEGDVDSSNALLERIIKEFPNGRFAQEAYFRLGEYYFEARDKSKAISYYRQVLKKDDYNLDDKALYKLGWALFQNKDYEGAADKFISLLERKGIKLTPEGKEEIKELSVVEKDMVWDSIKTLILVFDYMGGHSKIADYFKVRGIQGFEPYIYRRLGDIYLETGRFKEAADTYEAFVNTNPFHEDAPLFQSKVIEAYTRGNMFDLAHNSRVKLIDTYREDGLWFKSSRRRAQKRARNLVQLNKPLVKHDMFQLAKYRYSTARFSKKEKDYAEAIIHMRRFIDNFPQEPESVELKSMLAEVNFLLAETYFDMKDYHNAATEYEKVAYQYQPSAFSVEAGYGALLALEKLAKPAGSIRADNSYTLRLAEGCKDFAKTFPKDRRVPEVLINGADILSQVGKFEEGRSMAHLVIEDSLSTEREKYMAQRLIAESFLKEQSYKKSEEEIRKAIALIPESDKKDLPLLERALGASLYKQAEDLKSQGKALEAAGAFEKVYHTVPNSDIAPVALYDAGVLLEQNMEWEKAIKDYAILFQKYPGSRYAFDALTQWGEIKEKLKDYANAAQVYERAADIATEGKLKEDVFYKAILMYERGEDLTALYNSYRKFWGEFPESPRMVELTYRVANSRESVKDFGTARGLYERVVLLHKNLGAGATIEESALAARAQLILSDYKKMLFEGVKLSHPLEENLKKKEDLLKDALAGYMAAAKYRISDITTETTYKMGEMLDHFRDAILESERPKKLTPEQLEEYNFLLEEQAYPFEEKAINAFEGNVRRTTESGIYDEWIKKSYESLARLLPVRYKREEVGETYSGDISSVIPDDPEIYNSRGILFRKNGEFKRAEEDYLKSISIRPDLRNAFLNLGILYELYLGKPEDALKNYKEYVRLGGGREDVLVWIDIIEKKIGTRSQN